MGRGNKGGPSPLCPTKGHPAGEAPLGTKSWGRDGKMSSQDQGPPDAQMGAQGQFLANLDVWVRPGLSEDPRS